MTSYKEIEATLKAAGNPEKATFVMSYFKTGKGGYGANDIFLGITVPETRKIARQFKDTPLPEVAKLLASPIHECRLCALEILVYKMIKADDKTQKEIYDLYLKNTKYVNNWDLVDGSAPTIMGIYLKDKDPSILKKLAKSTSVWERRIAIVGTGKFIKDHDFKNTLEIAEILLHDPHDLIHKAVGWFLREVGNKDRKIEEDFLKKHYTTMPRTMLRYAIEKFPEPLRKAYLKGTI